MKKLTAGIFTALLGLVTVNAANAAIPSTNYVNEHIDAVRSRIDNVETAYKNADTALGTRVTELETTVGKGTMSVNGNEQNDVITAINALDEKTNGIATNTALETLQQTVTTHTNSLNVLNGTGEGSVAKAETDAVATANDYTDQLANGQVKTNKEAIAANTQAIADNATATTNALALKANTADLGDLAFKNTVATSDLDSTLQTAVGQVATNKSNIESLTTTVGTKASQADLDTAESAIADNAAAISLKASQADLNATNAEVAKKADAATMTTELAKKADAATMTTELAKKADAATMTTKLAEKVDIARGAGAANHVVITDTDGNVTTSATITQGQVENLTTALNAKMPLTTTDTANIGVDGTYVLTATTEGGVTTYKWEQIERSTPK